MASVRALPSRIQARLAHYYGIDDAPDVGAFVRAVDGDERESLIIRDMGEAIELALHLPRSAIEAGGRASFDGLCQVVEGVSHFLYVAERARRDLPVTQLEMELQAEVDKYVMLCGADVGPLRIGPRYDVRRGTRIRQRLFDRVVFSHPAGTEVGDRYRMANDLAARFAGKLERSFASRGRFAEMRAALRRFYAAGQTEKLELARAA